MAATTTEVVRLDETFAALASSTRRALLARLAQGPATVNELAEPFDLGLPAISKHVKVLGRTGRGPPGRRASTAWTGTSPRCRRKRSETADEPPPRHQRRHGHHGRRRDRTDRRRPDRPRVAHV